MQERWFWWVCGPADGAWNMAADEMLLRQAVTHARPVLRVYRWSRPAVSFGYFQPYPLELASQYELVRRPT
ncbi:MAG: hypothetical protein N3A53_08100, partial [Verrucomicrobiae bacterium]|nr:hypothetical protein [Verrucomicrobiae bacterium]